MFCRNSSQREKVQRPEPQQAEDRLRAPADGVVDKPEVLLCRVLSEIWQRVSQRMGLISVGPFAGRGSCYPRPAVFAPKSFSAMHGSGDTVLPYCRALHVGSSKTLAPPSDSSFGLRFSCHVARFTTASKRSIGPPFFFLWQTHDRDLQFLHVLRRPSARDGLG